MAHSTHCLLFLSPFVGCSHFQSSNLVQICNFVIIVLNRCTPKDNQMSSRPLDLFFYTFNLLCQLPTSYLRKQLFGLRVGSRNLKPKLFSAFLCGGRRIIKNQVGKISKESSEISKESLEIVSPKPLKAAPRLICD